MAPNQLLKKHLTKKRTGNSSLNVLKISNQKLDMHFQLNNIWVNITGTGVHLIFC